MTASGSASGPAEPLVPPDDGTIDTAHWYTGARDGVGHARGLGTSHPHARAHVMVVLAGAFPGSQGIHDPTDLLTSAQRAAAVRFPWPAESVNPVGSRSKRGEMSDFANRWVSPHWGRFPVEPNHAIGPAIWVLNPGTTQAKVTVTWFNLDGSIVSQEEQPIPPKQSHAHAFMPTAGVYGWARVVSDQPVAPWGATPDQEGDADPDRVNMTFFREDLQVIPPIHPIP